MSLEDKSDDCNEDPEKREGDLFEGVSFRRGSHLECDLFEPQRDHKEKWGDKYFLRPSQSRRTA